MRRGLYSPTPRGGAIASCWLLGQGQLIFFRVFAWLQFTALHHVHQLSRLKRSWSWEKDIVGESEDLENGGRDRFDQNILYLYMKFSKNKFLKIFLKHIQIGTYTRNFKWCKCYRIFSIQRPVALTLFPSHLKFSTGHHDDLRRSWGGREKKKSVKNSFTFQVKYKCQ